ncbi:MAG: GH116 family glycosyl-hydrolase, partial [Phycisphaerae bacterium]
MTDVEPAQRDVSRRSVLKVIAAASAAMVLTPPLSATAKAHAEEIGVPLRGPDGRIIVFHPPMASGIPLGGMGAGTFEIRADGGMYEWQIFNNWGQRLVLPDTFFAIRANETGKSAVTRRLETIRHSSNPGQGVKNITYEGRSPIARLRYDEPALPVKVSLTAWFPLIPHQPRESGVPAAVFTFELTNHTANAVHAILLGSIRNAVALNNGWTGTQNRLERSAAMTAIHMSAR